MNKKYLEENNLMEAHKQFMRLCEWSYVPSKLSEEGEEEDPNAQGADPMASGDPMGGDPNTANGDMGAEGDMGADPMASGDPNAAGGDPSMGGGEGASPMGAEGDMGGQDPMMGGDPNADPMASGDPMMSGEEPMGNEMEEDDEEVIDVEELTNAQEKMNHKVNTVGKEVGEVEDTIAKLMRALEKMQGMVDSNNAKIEDFQREFEKRNPTETEKLNLRSLDSYPFNVNPKDYWDSKNTDPNSNYGAYADNGEPTTQEYQITNSDVDDFDEKQIEDSFNIDDDLNQTIEKIFGL